jgi:hypothetical protein
MNTIYRQRMPPTYVINEPLLDVSLYYTHGGCDFNSNIYIFGDMDWKHNGCSLLDLGPRIANASEIVAGKVALV